MEEEFQKYKEQIEKLNNRKAFLLKKRKKADEELKYIERRLKYYNDRIKKREIEDTVILAKKANLEMSDLKKILKTGNADKIKEMLKEED